MIYLVENIPDDLVETDQTEQSQTDYAGSHIQYIASLFIPEASL